MLNNNEVAQTYIGNPALFKGNKFDLRVYMLISSTDPFRVFYHDGFLRVSLQAYDKNSTNLDVHLTNTSQSFKIIEKVKDTGEKHMGMTLEELEDF